MAEPDTCGNCANQPCGYYREADHGGCEQWFGHGSMEQARCAIMELLDMFEEATQGEAVDAEDKRILRARLALGETE